MAKNAIRIPTDGRTRYEHQAYDVTYAGKSKETGALGYDSRLSATYEANFQITVDVSATGTHVFVLPSWVYSNGYLIVEGGGGSPVAQLEVSDLDGGNAVTLAADIDMGSVTATKAAYDAGVVIDVEEVDQVITIDVTTAGTGYATIVIQATIVQTAWK